MSLFAPSLKNKRFAVIPLLAFMLLPLVSLQSADVKFIPNKANFKEIVLENEQMRYTLIIDGRVKMASALDKTTGVDVFDNNPPLTMISSQFAWNIIDVGVQMFTAEESKSGDKATVTITEQSTYYENPIIVTHTFSLGSAPDLEWKASFLNNGKLKPEFAGNADITNWATLSSNVMFPIMQRLRIGTDTDDHHMLFYYGANYIDSYDDFILYFTNATDPRMPIDIYNDKEDLGVYFHILESQFDWSFASVDDFKSNSYTLGVAPNEEKTVINCRIVPHKGDWHAAFDAFKKYIRGNFDFTYYKRPVQDKYRQRFVSHFTFLYSHEIYDPETNTFKIHEFLDEGEANFGGYDYMLLWHDYPRLGVDNRDQFDVYSELPGGLEGLRKMVDEAHSRNVQVFIPYKPWDTMKGGKDHFKQEAAIAKAIGADGIFLDTMGKSDISFRTEVDAVSTDIVFVSEGRPALEAAELVTGSWNQSGPATNKMPNVDLFRFVFPEHNVHNINRGARKRDELILNALFNGVGFIVWEDIFGEINKYSWNERIMIQRYNRIIHENRDAYLTDSPVPLIDALHPKLFVNEFAIDSKVVYPAYQLDRANVNRMIDDRLIGPFLEVDQPDNWHFVDVWNHQMIPVQRKSGKSRLVFPEEPADVMSCIVGFPKNLAVEVVDGKIGIQATNPVKGGAIHVNTVNNLTMMEQEVLKIDGNTGQAALSDIDLKTPHKVLVKLMEGDVLKDEVILDLGWKQF
ncbi:hypothetical protein ACFL45_10980 [Candidatus Neomarinimicrobiota bacterium]